MDKQFYDNQKKLADSLLAVASSAEQFDDEMMKVAPPTEEELNAMHGEWLKGQTPQTRYELNG